MNASVSTHNATHYRWGGVCDGWHLLAGDDLSVIEERMPPGATELRHRHARARQFFYVLNGVVTLEAGVVTYSLKAGEGLHIPPGTAHQMCNQCTVDLRFMVISAPKSHGDRELVPPDEVD